MMDNSKEIGQSIKRLPGQALREKRSDIFDREITDPLMIAFSGWMVLIMECLHVWGKIKPSIWAGLIIMLCTSRYAAKKYFRGRRKIRDYRRGEQGERIVAQAIEQDLIPNGYAVFHDIPLMKDGRSFNIDHLVIGENGIFAIETKYYRKPSKGSPEVTYDGKNLLWNGVKHEKDEIAQAISAAKAAKALIEELTGLKVYVKPVLCAVGWFAKSTDLYGHPVLLVMEKTLASVIQKVTPMVAMAESDRRRISVALKRNNSN